MPNRLEFGCRSSDLQTTRRMLLINPSATRVIPPFRNCRYVVFPRRTPQWVIPRIVSCHVRYRHHDVTDDDICKRQNGE